MSESLRALRRCKTCGSLKWRTDFYANPKGRDGLRPECKECTKARRRAWYARNRERELHRVLAWQAENPDMVRARADAFRAAGKKRTSDRKSHLKRNYGLTLADYDAMLAQQGGGCAICGREPGDNKTLHVDHDHTTREVRGLLCFTCNNALGDFDDSVERLVKAIDYLDREAELTLLVRERTRALATS